MKSFPLLITPTLLVLVICCHFVQIQAQDQVEYDTEIVNNDCDCDTCVGDECTNCNCSTPSISSSNCGATGCRTNCGSNCATNCESNCASNNCGSECGSSNCIVNCARPCQQACPTYACRRSCLTSPTCVRRCTPRYREPPVRDTTIVRQVDDTDKTSSSSHHLSNPLDTKNDVNNNVTTTLNLNHVVSNNNTIHIPVTHTFNHESNVHVVPPSPATISINISSVNPAAVQPPVYPPPVYPQQCCTVVPPKQCTYEQERLNCSQQPHKVCGDVCTSPLVMQHPKPIYIPVPVPVDRQHYTQVPVPQPYPVYERIPIVQRINVPQPYPVYERIPIVQRINVPQPYPVYQRIPVVERVNVPQPIPVPVTQYIPHYQQVPVQQVPCVTPCQLQQAHQSWYIQPMQVQPPPMEKIVQYQLPVQQQQIPIPTPVQEQLQQHTQQICPISIWNGVKYPTCSSIAATKQFIGTTNRFLLDQYQHGTNSSRENIACKAISHYPWMQCYKQNIQDCKNCVYCDGTYNPQKCMYAANCSRECQQAMIDLNLPERMGRTLSCQLIGAAVKCT